MALPPVIAELRANTSDYMARMAEARKSWGQTATAIADPAPMARAEASLARLGGHAAQTSREAGVLGETSRETFGEMQAGLATVVPGYGELSGVLGRVSEQFTHIGEKAKLAQETAAKAAAAHRLEIDRVNLALDAENKRMGEVAEGSRGWKIAQKNAAEYQLQIAALNKSLEKTLAEQAAASKGVVGGKAKVAAGGVAAAGVAVAAVVGYEGIKNAMKEQEQLALLRNAVEKTKKSWEDYEPALESAQSQLRKMGVADGDTARSAQTLTTALKDPEKALNLVGLAANIARARHIDLAAATATVSKIATGHTGSMSRLGLASKDAAGHTYTAKQAIDALGKAYGGASATYAGTLQGKMATFKAQTEHVLVAIGNGLIPVVSDLMSKLAETAGWINEHVVPSLKNLYSWFVEKILPGIERVVHIVVGSLQSAWDRITKATDGQSSSLSKLVSAFKRVSEFIVNDVMPVIAKLNAFFLDLVARAMVPVIVILAKVVDAFGWLVKASGDAAAALLTYFVKPVVDGMLWMAEKTVGLADKAFGWIPGLGGKLDSAKAGIADFAASTNTTLASWAGSAAKWGNDHSAAVKDASDVANKAAKEAPKFDISGGYADGVKNVADASKKAKALHDKAAEEAKKRREAEKKALADQKAHLKAEADAALRAAQYVADKRAAQLQAALNAANEAARQLDVANKLAGGGPGNLNIYDGAILNRGTSFAQAAARAGGTTTINVNVAGNVTSERDLLAAFHEQLQKINRTNINAGLN